MLGRGDRLEGPGRICFVPPNPPFVMKGEMLGSCGSGRLVRDFAGWSREGCTDCSIEHFTTEHFARRCRWLGSRVAILTLVRLCDTRYAARPHARVVYNVFHATLCFWLLVSEFSRTYVHVWW